MHSRLLLRSVAIIAAGTAMAHAQDHEPPRPVALWPDSPLNLALAFSQPAEPEWSRTLVGRSISILDTASNRAGDQSPAPALGKLQIAGVTILDGGRTLMLATDPHAAVATYALDPGSGGRSNRPWTYDLSGVEVIWSTRKENEGQGPDWKGWWPDLDLDVCRQLLTGSASHERGFRLLDQPGHLTLNTLLSLPAGEAVARIEAGGTVSDATLGDEQPAAQAADSKAQLVEFSLTTRGDPLFLTLTVPTGEKHRPPSLRASWAPGKNRPFAKVPRQWYLLPWAPVAPTPAALDAVPDLKGGDPKRGETLFFSQQARCSQCHRVGDRGGTIGPDLTNVAAKGQAYIYRSIAAPSAEIAPEYRPFTVALHDGRVLAGIVRASGAGMITVTDTGAKTMTLRRDAVEQIRPSATSIMPVGLAGVLGSNGLRDLIAYLTSKGAAGGKPPGQTD